MEHFWVWQYSKRNKLASLISHKAYSPLIKALSEHIHYVIYKRDYFRFIASISISVTGPTA